MRGRPTAVAAYTTANGCILAASVEAKKLGVKTGMRVKDGRLLAPALVVLPPDPGKYRDVHLKFRRLVADYTNDFSPKSIDEFVLNLENYPCLAAGSICQAAKEIKTRIKSEIGEWLTVSVGIGPNRFLAKLGAGLHKPDGLDVIDKDNFLDIYSRLSLTDLPYIKLRNAARLNLMGIFTVTDFYNAPVWKLKAAFASINGYYWYLRLRGWETCPQSLCSGTGRRVDDVTFGRKSYGNSYALPKPLKTLEELSPILSKLVEKMGARLRRGGYNARGVHVAVSYRDGSFWHKGVNFSERVFDSRDIYKKALHILAESGCKKPVRNLAVSVFNIEKFGADQLNLFGDIVRQRKLVDAIDKVNRRWGDFVITPARMSLADPKSVPDRIAFGQPAEATHQAFLTGGVKELEEFINN